MSELKNFKVGDKVRCTVVTSPSLAIGCVYTVIHAEYHPGDFYNSCQEWVGFEELGDLEALWNACNFELVEEIQLRAAGETVVGTVAREHYAMFNKTTMEIKCLSLTPEQLAYKVAETKDLTGYKEITLWLDN